MADDKMNFELGLSVKTEGTEKLTDLDKMLLRIKAAQDRYNSTLGKGSSAQAKAAKEALQGTQERMRVLRMQFAYQDREQKNLAREEQRSIREAGRLRSQENRRALAEARELNRERDRAVTRIGRGAGQVRGGLGRAAGVGAAAAAAGTYAAQRAVDGLTRAGMNIDEAMTASMIHIFGEQDTTKSRKSAEALRQKLMPVASKLGTKTADLIGAYVEAAQAGIPDALLAPAVEYGAKYAKMNKLSSSDVLEQSGYAIQALKSFGAVGEAEIKGYYDEVSFLIATTSANRKELLAATKVGMSSGATVGMDRQQTLSVLGLATAYGAEGSQAARLLSNQGARASGWRNKGRNILSKHTRNADDRQFLDAVSILGYRDSDAMADAFSRDFFGSLVNVQEKLKGVSDPLKRKAITKQLFGQEFSALVDSMIMGGQLQEFRDKLRGASGYLSKSWDKFTTGFEFIMDKLGVVMSNLTESMGIALKPLWGEVSAWVDRFQGFGRMGEAVTNFTNGLIRGFGANSVTELLNRVLGDPSKFTLNMSTVFQAGKGFAEGITSVATGIKSLFSAFAGPDADAQAIGKLTGQILALSAALTVAAPALVVLGSLTAILRGLGAAGAGVAGLLGGGARAAGAAGTAAGAGAMGAAILTKAGQLIGLAFLAEVAQHFNVLKMDGSKGLVGNLLEEFVPAPLRRWLDSDKGQPLGQGQGWQDVGPSKRLEEMRESLDKNTAELKKNTQATQDDVKKAAETKAAELKAEEARKLSELVSIRNGAMSGSVGGGSSTVDQLRSRGFRNIIGDGGSNAGSSGGMPQADAGGTRSGGTRSWRNRNPGNLKDGPFARRMGAIGRDAGGFAVFPDDATGRKAQAALLFDNEKYKNLSIRDAIARYAPGSDGNDPASYAAQMARAAGVGVDTKLSDLTPAQREKFLDAQRDKEGWRAGTTTGGASVSGPLTTDGPVRANLMHGQYGRPGENLGRLVTGNGKSAMVNNAALESFQGFVRELESQGYNIKSLGGFNNRMVRGGNRLSQHAYGNAIDLNPGNNPLGTSITDMPDNVRALAKKYGLIWGMDWRGRKDPMHFEWNGTQPWKNAQEAIKTTRDLAGGIQARPTPPGATPGPGGSPSQPGSGPQSMLSVPQTAPAPKSITSGVPQGAGRRNGGGAGGGVTVNIAAVHGGDPKSNGEEVGKQVRSAVNSSYIDVDGYGYA